MDVTEFSDSELLAHAGATKRMAEDAEATPSAFVIAIQMRDWHERLKAEAIRRGLIAPAADD